MEHEQTFLSGYCSRENSRVSMDPSNEGTVETLSCRTGQLTHAAEVRIQELQHRQAELETQVEQLLQEQKRCKAQLSLLDEVQRISKTGGWTYETATGVLTWTEEVYRIYGVDAGFDLGDVAHAVSFYAPEDREVIHRAFHRAVTDGEPYDLELRFVPRHGDEIWVRTIGNPLVRNGRVERVTGNILDITDRKATEEKLRKSEERYKAVVEDQTETISRFTADGTFLFANDVYCRFFGKSLDELLGNTWYPVAFIDDLPKIEEQLQNLTPGNPVVVIENRVYDASGNVRWMQFVNRGFFDSAGQLLETQSVGRDITDRKHAEEALHSCAHRLIDMEESLRKQLAMELHDEVGRDLTALGFNLAIISDNHAVQENWTLSSRIRDSLRLTEDISRLIRNLMTKLRPPVLDDYGLVAALRWHADLFSKRTGIAVTIEAEYPAPGAKPAVEMTLFRIAQEALTNCSKHAAAQHATITLRCANGVLRMAISDDGTGIITPLREQSGWGMTIMNERAESIGGNLRLESEKDRGTTVSVELPMEEA